MTGTGVSETTTYPTERGRSMRRFITTRKRLTALAVVVAVLGVSVAAVAFFTGGGSGSGTATVGTGGAVTLTATVTPGITPGPGGAEPVSFTAANPSSAPIAVTTVHLASVTVDSAHATCIPAASPFGDFSMADVTEGTGNGQEVAAGATAQALPTGGSLVMADTTSNQDACKGATLTLNLTSS